MNNRQANRRRGRSNNRGQQGRGGYDHQNRIDNRARGNAAQMLDKYKKLASDAQMNGDRVQAEYYHQFADHYFRVQADFQARKDEQQAEKQRRQGGNDGRGNDSEGDDNRQQRGRDNRNDRNDRADNDRDYDDDRAERDDDNKRDDDSRGNDKQDKPRKARGRPQKSDNDGSAATIDNSALPPAINADSDDDKPARKPRTRRPRNAEGDEQADAAE